MPVKRTDKTPMPTREAQARAHDFEEVNEGYCFSHAMFEAERCLRCQDPVCIDGCPVRVPIADFMHAIAANDMRKAADLLRGANPLAAICGRVCPQESQCEMKCHMTKRFGPVAIGHLERFVSDWEMQQPTDGEPLKPWREEKVAIVGSGPSGLVCAGELARMGYPVTVYEALHAPGGVLRYGIPEFRLPNAILDWEIAALERLGVEFVNNVIIGKTLTLDQLFGEMGYAAVFIGTGAGLPKFMGIPGESLNGVYSANEFLTRINLMQAFDFPNAETPLKVGRRVAVIGSGNTARRVMGLPPQRIAEFEEYLKTLIPLLRGEESEHHFAGEVHPIRHIMPDKGFVNFEDPIPLYISGFGPRSLGLAGKYGDGAVIARITGKDHNNGV